MSDSDVTLGELYRQGEAIKSIVNSLDSKLDTAQNQLTTHDGAIARNTSDIAEIRADLKSKRVTTGTIAGIVATVITVTGEIIGHLK